MYGVRGADHISMPFLCKAYNLCFGSAKDGGTAKAQLIGSLQKVKENLRKNDMSFRNIIKLEVSLADITDWPSVQSTLRSELFKISMPAITVVQSKFVDDAVKVQLNVEASVTAVQMISTSAPVGAVPMETGWTGHIGLDTINGIAYLSGVVAPSSAANGTYGEQIIAIMPVIEAQLKSVGMDLNNLVMISVATETTPKTDATARYEQLKDFNQAYNTLMIGTEILPSMLTYYVDAFPGADAEGLQIQVTATAARHRQVLSGEATKQLQVSAPVPENAAFNLTLPFSSVVPSMGNGVWLAGFGYYGTSADMTVATTDVMNQMANTLKAVNLSLQAVVHADILVAEAGRQRLDELAKVYNSYFLAEGEGAVPVLVPPPTLSVREVAGIDLESPLEITVTATRANDKRRSYSRTADSP